MMSGPAEQPALAQVPGIRLPWRTRFSAWWNGQELIVRAKGSDEARERTDEEAVGEQPSASDAPDETLAAEKWPPQRLDVAQWMWGEGFISPGGAIHIMNLAAPLDMKNGRDLLFMCAGLGGPAKLLVESNDIRARIWELNPHLQAVSREAVEPYDPEAPDATPETFDYIVAKESFFSIANKPWLLDTLTARLSERGQILFTDYVLGAQSPDDGVLANWLKREPVQRFPVTAEDHLEALAARNLKVRKSEDMTAAHRELVQRGFEYLRERLSRGKPEADYVPLLQKELALWTARVAAMDAGVLKVHCIHAGR